MSLSDYYEDALLDTILEASLYLALCTADPTDAGTGAAMNEVADAGSYARVNITTATWAAASGGDKTTEAVITFPAATAGWGTVTHWAILDSTTHGAGNILWHGALTAEKVIASGDTPRVPIGDATLSVD